MAIRDAVTKGTTDPVASALRAVDDKLLGFFRFREVAGQYLLVGETGKWIFLSPDEFAALIQGRIAPTEPLYAELAKRNLVRPAMNIQREVNDYQSKNRWALAGPTLHILIMTLRCNHVCRYCHASRKGMDKTEYDMTPETADKVLDLVFQTTSQDVTIEFQGGEPLANYPVVKHVIEQARERNKAAGKKLTFSLVSNLSLLDDEKLEFLLDNHVQICTSIDGPADLHDHNRTYTGGNSFEETVFWMKKVNEGYAARGLDPSLYHVEALLTVTRPTLERWKDVVDTYVELGCNALFLRPLNPFGFAKGTFEKIGYTSDEFLEFYRKALDYVLQKNREGYDLLERFAAIFLTKMLTPFDPNYLDIRSPCGAGIGQVAYNYDGRVFTCDEGRMVAQMGDDSFAIGNVGESSYKDLMEHETVKAIAVASCLDGLPDCIDCAYNPFCGTCPVYNYTEQGNIFQQARTNEKCKIHKAIMDHLFGMLAANDPEKVDVLSRWTRTRDRQLFYQRV